MAACGSLAGRLLVMPSSGRRSWDECCRRNPDYCYGQLIDLSWLILSPPSVPFLCLYWRLGKDILIQLIRWHLTRWRPSVAAAVVVDCAERCLCFYQKTWEAPAWNLLVFPHIDFYTRGSWHCELMIGNCGFVLLSLAVGVELKKTSSRGAIRTQAGEWSCQRIREPTSHGSIKR